MSGMFYKCCNELKIVVKERYKSIREEAFEKTDYY